MRPMLLSVITAPESPLDNGTLIYGLAVVREPHLDPLTQARQFWLNDDLQSATHVG